MKKLFTNGLIINGLGSYDKKGWVLIEKDKILAVGSPSDEPPKGENTEIINLGGKTLMPGLIDAHVHIVPDGSPDFAGQFAEPLGVQAIKGARNAMRSLEAGITTVRDLGGKDYINLHVRDAVDTGLVEGCRILSSGHVLCMTGGHGWFTGIECDGPDALRRGARQEIKAGADCIKLIATGGVLTPNVNPSFPQLSQEEMQAAIEEAHNAGLKTATHAQGTPGIANAVRAGIDSVEHAYYLTQEIVDIMLEKGIFLIPTIISLTNIVNNAEGKGIPEWAVEKARRVMKAAKTSHTLARECGVRIAMGTDAGTPHNFHGENGNELAAMVDWGFSPMQAIVAATSSAADLLGLKDSIGTIEPGKKADLLVVNGNPLEDISLLGPDGAIEQVLKGGEPVAAPEKFVLP